MFGKSIILAKQQPLLESNTPEDSPPQVQSLGSSISRWKRFAPILWFWFVGLVIALIIGYTPVDYMPIALSILLIFFVTAQGIWLNQVISSLKLPLRTKQQIKSVDTENTNSLSEPTDIPYEDTHLPQENINHVPDSLIES